MRLYVKPTTNAYKNSSKFPKPNWIRASV